MSLQTFNECLVAQKASGSQFNSFTTAKTVLPAQSLFQFPPNYITTGKAFRVRVRGALSTLVTTPGTVTFQIMLGTIVVWTSGAVQMNATAHTTLPFFLEVDLMCQVDGSGTTAKFLGMGTLSGIMFTLTAGQTDAPNTPGVFQVPSTAPAQGTGFDSTVANILDFWVGFSISNAANLVQIHLYTVEALN